MNLSDRKKKILQIVVDDYIATATPISSKQIQEQHLSGVSSATIRNELSSLEDMGYLIQPHTSSGRVPSSKAYRLYVAELMKKQKLTESELNYINTYFDSQVVKIQDIVKSAAKLISDITNYTAVAVPSGSHTAEKITEIKLLKITERNSFLIIVINREIIKDALLTNPEDTDEVALKSAADILNRMFVGREITDLIINEERLESEFQRYRYLFKTIINVLKDYVNGGERDMVFEGQSKILQYPEYNDMAKAKQFFEIMDSKKYLMSMLNGDTDSGIEVTINIGNDLENKEIPSDCSIVTARYKAGGKLLGSAGVIGPSRMQYGKVISVLDNVGAVLNSIVENSEDPQKID